METYALTFLLGVACAMLGLCLLGETVAIKRAGRTLMSLVDVVLPTGKHSRKWWRAYVIKTAN